MFGNQGALYMNAMTWWDHETQSVWSQVTGEALYGPLQGARLRQIPASVETWKTWWAAHPNTRVLDTGGAYLFEPLTRDFVIAIRIGGDSAAFAFPVVAEQGVVNEEVGGAPIAIYARDDGLVRVFSREVEGRVVVLVDDEGWLVDPTTGSTWDPVSGRGIDGPLAGDFLIPVAWATSYDWAWRDFYPEARIVD